MNKLSLKSGFTLIELLVVILIIVILGTFGMVSYSQATKSARDAKRKSDMEVMKQALIMYRQDVGNYPGPLFADAVTALTTGGYLGADAAASLKDPGTSSAYVYATTGSGSGFYARAAMENTANGNNSASGCTSAGFTSASTKTYYCVVSP